MKNKISVCLFIICLAFVLYALKSNAKFSFEYERHFDNPVNVIQDDKLMVVIDKHQSRINFINEKNVLVNTLYLPDPNLITDAFDCDLDGKYVYINGSVIDEADGSVLKSKIVRYNYDGKYVDTIYETDCPEKINFCETTILDLRIQDDKIYFINRTDLAEIEIYEIYNDKTTLIDKLDFGFSIYFASYSPEMNKLYFQDYLGTCYTYNIDTEKIENKFNIKNGACMYSVYTKDGLYYSDMQNKIIYDSNGNSIATDVVTFLLNYRNPKLLFCDIPENKVCIYDIDTKELTQFESVKISFSGKLKTLLTMFASVYLILFILVNFVKKIINLFQQKEFDSVKKTFYAFVFIFSSIGISVYYTKNIYETKFEAVRSHVYYVSKIIAKGFSSELMEIFNSKFAVGIPKDVSNKDCVNAYMKFSKYFDSFIETNIKYPEYVCFYQTNGNEHFVFYDSSGMYQLGTPSEIVSSVNYHLYGKDFLNVKKYTNDGGSFICAREPVYDKFQNEVGVIEFAHNNTLLKKAIFKTCLELTIGILVIGATLYMFIIELISVCKTFIRKKQLKASGEKYNESIYSRQYAFIADFINGIDIIITTFTLKELCQLNNYDLSQTAFVISLLPLVLYCGSLIGSLLYSFIINRINVKRFNTIFTTGMIVFICIQILGVKENNLTLFLSGKFFYYIMQMNVYILTTAIADNAQDDNSRYEFHKGTTWASVTAGVLSSALGGYIAELFGNIYVYYAAAGLSVLLLVFGFFILPRDKIYGRSSKKNYSAGTSKLELVKFVFSPKVFAYIILISVPFAIVRNYKSILFPLFSADFNLPKIYISNIYIIARTLNMIVSSKIDGAVKTDDYRKKASAALVFIGCLFCGFILNNTILWAAIMLVMADLYVKLTAPIHKMIEGSDAEFYHIPRDKAKGAVQTVNSLCSCLQTPILAFFLLFGTTKACIFVGLICIASALIYFVFIFKRKNKS